MTVEHIDAMTGEILPSLAECEETIARGVRGYVEAGEALRTIRDARLYRETHATFEDYCRERWGWNDSRARQLIGAAEIVTTVTALGAPAPANEAQARELVGLPAEEAAQIMDAAVERTGPIGTLILITDDEMRDILTHIAGAGDREPFDRLHDRWTSLRYDTRSGPEVPARGRVVSDRHTTLRIPL